MRRTAVHSAIFPAAIRKTLDARALYSLSLLGLSPKRDFRIYMRRPRRARLSMMSISTIPEPCTI